LFLTSIYQNNIKIKKILLKYKNKQNINIKRVFLYFIHIKTPEFLFRNPLATIMYGPMDPPQIVLGINYNPEGSLQSIVVFPV